MNEMELEKIRKEFHGRVQKTLDESLVYKPKPDVLIIHPDMWTRWHKLLESIHEIP